MTNNPVEQDPKPAQDATTQAEEPQEQLVQTQHAVVVAGEEIAYTATVGTIKLRGEDEQGAKALVFFIAYTRNDVTDARQRPITFSFNGGPGSSSVWLHLGLLGPRRVLMDEDGAALPPPYHLVNNEFSLLDQSDLVFIDPVSTGFSRTVPGEKPDQFHGYEQDIEAVGEFIRVYLSRQGRWGSPKFLIGESYGTTRAAGLSAHLQSRYGLYLNGIMLISSILAFQTAHFSVGNDLPYVLFLPTYTATAWYHRRLPATLQADLPRALEAAESFAMNEYTLALMKGASLGDEERESVASRLAELTGLSREYVEQSNLRIHIQRFVKELLRDQRRTVGRLDSRLMGFDRNAVGETPEFDPSMAAIMGPYAGALNDYVRTELNFESDLTYEILTRKVRPWKFDKHQNEFLNVGESLRQAMSQNPYLKVFVGNGYYDLATPYFATEYTFNHLELDPSLHANITMGYYQAGHMMYIHFPSLAAVKQDLAAFIADATAS